MKKPRKSSESQNKYRKLVGDIVRKFLPERVDLLAATEWREESVACAKLIKQYTAPFLLATATPKFKINSLYFFFTAGGKKYLIDEKARIQAMELVSEPNSGIEKYIEKNPLNIEPEQHNIVKRPKNKLEFLNQ